jgi:alpha-L-fucosidase
MKYKDLVKTFEILSSYDPEGIVFDWAEHDEWGITLDHINLSPEDIRTIAEMECWGLGCDEEYNEEEMKPWYNPQNYTTEEIVEVYNNYKSIYTYA